MVLRGFPATRLGKSRWRGMHTGDPCGDRDSPDVEQLSRHIMELRMKSLRWPEAGEAGGAQSIGDDEERKIEMRALAA